jgi:hypothetical protein
MSDRVSCLGVIVGCGLLSIGVPAQAIAAEVGAERVVAVPTRDAPRFLTAGVGYTGAFRGSKRTIYSLEYRFRENHYGIYTALYLGGAPDAQYVNFSLGYAHAIGRDWVAAISSGPGVYTRGLNGLDLGHSIEFLSRIEIARILHSSRRLGLRLAHVSNAHFSQHNPGAESVSLIFTVPLNH